jgi:hypothetical protein
MLFRSALLVAVALSVDGQTAVKDALGLTEMQIWQLRQQKPAAGRRRADFDKDSLNQALANPILDASQQAALAGIVKILNHLNMASEAIVAGLISPRQWPGSTLCPSSIASNPSEFSLSDSQVRQLERLRDAARQPLDAQIAEQEKVRADLLNSGLPTDQATGAISKSRQQWSETAPPRDLAIAVLDQTQRATLAAFETALQLVREAIDLNLIPDPSKGEVLCQ